MEPEVQPIILYRVFENHANDRTHLYFREYKVIRSTPTGHWIKVSYGDVKWYGSGEKWTSFVSARRWAYDTKEAALQSFLARKNRQIKIVSYSLQLAQSSKRKALEMLYEINPGLIPFNENYEQIRK
jgi:hypothetical protein